MERRFHSISFSKASTPSLNGEIKIVRYVLLGSYFIQLIHRPYNIILMYLPIEQKKIKFTFYKERERDS